jgi:pimeloyl-ACP methyl ester carboxylesterase
LVRISASVVWIGGAESPWLGPVVDDWLSVRPEIHQTILPGAGHMVQNDVPEALAAEIVGFVERVLNTV